MSLYRGAGGASDATDDSTVNAVAGYASAAASSASAAATSATNASNSATAAASSASSAASSASSVATNASNAASSAGLANTYATAASASKDAAAASATTASTKAGQASSSASEAGSSASTAAVHATNASTSASAAAASASDAATSASNAADSAADALAIYGNTTDMNNAVAAAATSAVNAATSAAEADDSRVLAEAAVTGASSYASAAQASANDSQAYAGTSEAYAGASEASKDSALAAASDAADSALEAANSAAAAAAVSGSGNGTFVNTPITTNSTVTLSSGTANGVAYLNGSKALTTGSALTFDGSLLNVSGNANITGNTTLGDASTDTVQVNGYMGVGGAAPNASFAIQAAPTALTGTSQVAVNGDVTGTSAATTAILGVGGRAKSTAAVFTVTDAMAFKAYTNSKGTGSTFTNSHGLYIADQTDGTNNYGITSLVSSGTNKWNIYASGTAQNYFAGNVGIGTTGSVYSLEVAKSAGGVAEIALTSTGVQRHIIRQLGTGDGSLSIFNQTAGAERLRIDSNGNVGIGTSSPTSLLSVAGSANFTGNVTLGDATTDTVTVNGYMGVGGAGSAGSTITATGQSLTGTSQYGLAVTTTFNSASTVKSASVLALPATTASAWTSPLLAGFYAADASKGAGSTITNQHGLYIADQTQGTNNYGITSVVSSGSNKWNIYASGTAANYFAGNVGLGVTPSAWVSTSRALQGYAGGFALSADGTNNNQMRLSSNTYYNGTNWIYYGASTATSYEQRVGEHRWYNAASGTAGTAITFTQAMTLNASGNLSVGTTSSGARIVVADSASAISTTVTNGGILLRELGGSAANNTVELNIRPNSGKSGYLTFTESAIADRWSIGIANGDSGLRFVTGAGGGGTERMRIDSSGNLLVGTTNATPSIGVVLLKDAIRGIVRAATTVTTADALAEFYNPNGKVGQIVTNGTATSYATSSDYRLKENVQPMTGALAKVAQLKPVTYTWKTDGSAGEGFIAHELAEVCPQAVTGEKDAVEIQQYEISPAVPATYDEEGNELTPAVEAVMGEREVPKYQGIDVSFLVGTLTAAIQEQQAMIQELTARVAALESN